MHVVDLPLLRLQRRFDARPVNESTVTALVGSIAEIGLVNPLYVRPAKAYENGREVEGWEICAGGHRHAALTRLGRETAPCVVINDSDAKAELVMIDENLMRSELSPSERAHQTARRQELYEAIHPETRVGAHNQYSARGQLGHEQPRNPRFTKETAEATGKSERAVRRDAERGRKIVPDALAAVAGTPLDNGQYLDSLKDVPREEQATKVKEDLAAPKSAPKPKPASKPASALWSAWLLASDDERSAFLAEIGATLSPSKQ